MSKHLFLLCPQFLVQTFLQIFHYPEQLYFHLENKGCMSNNLIQDHGKHHTHNAAIQISR